MRKISRFLFRLITTVILLGALALAYAFFIEPQLLMTKDHNMEAKSEESSRDTTAYTVLQFSDLHMGAGYDEPRLDRLVKKINKISPDILVFTGDLYDNYSVENNDSMVVEKLSQMKAKCGKLAVWGNRDYGGGAALHYAEIMQKSGFHLLKNETEIIALPEGKTIAVKGLDDWLFGSPGQTDLKVSAADYRILLMHEPDAADQLPQDAADLILTGHSHGGQIRLPFTRVVTTRMARKYISGFYRPAAGTEDNLFVNTGLGTTRIHARFLVPPRIDVFHISL